MNNTFKKAAAVLSAAAIAVTLSGCYDNGYIMTVDGIKIRNGVYLSMQQTSFMNADNRLSELYPDSDDTDSSESSSSSSDETERLIDGKTYSEWVKDDTLKGIKRFVGVQRLCEQFGLELSEEERSNINKTVQEEWDSSDFYLQFLGYSAWGEYYETLGIGVDSLKEISLVDALNTKLFMHYYGEGGEKAVPDSEINEYIEENNAAYKLITLPYQDYLGDPLVTDEEKQELKDRAKDYADRYNNGEKFIDILYDFDLKKAQDAARKKAEEEYTEDNEEGLTKEEFVQKAIDEASATKGEADEDYDELINIDDEILSDELTAFLFSIPAEGKAVVFEGPTSAYVVIRKPVLELEGWKDHYLTDVLMEMKGDEFDSMMDLLCQNYDVEKNDYLVDKKYSPEKMKQ